MKKVLYTITTEIKKPNEEFVEYIEQYVKDFNSIQRKVFHRIKNRNINWKELKNKNALRKEISEDFGLTSKAAYSIVLNMIGRYNNSKEIKIYNLNNNENKITKLKKEIKKIEKGKDKKLLYLKKNELNYLNQKNNKLRKDIEDGNFAFCFGSKKLLKTNYEDFVKHRDSSILFTGDRNAQKLNSNFQVNYCKKKNNFNFKARKELYVENGKYIFGEFFLDKKSTKILKDILEFRKSGLTYRIILKNNKDVKHIAKENFNIYQSIEIYQGLMNNIDVSIYANNFFNENQMKEIKLGLLNDIDVSWYAKPKFSHPQMRIIREGLEEDLDVSWYANANLDWKQMVSILSGLEDLLDVSYYANSTLSFKEMEKIRRNLLEKST